MNWSRRLRLFAALLAAAGSAGGAAQASSVPNAAPTSGAIFDLNGLPAPILAPELYSFDFIAGLTETPLSFLFRDDPSFIEFSNVSVVNVNSPNKNLLTNANFQQTSLVDGVSLPNDWTYANVSAATEGPVVTFGGQVGCSAGSCAWVDGAEEGYDRLGQTVPTTVGSTYEVSFEAAVMGGISDWASVSTTGRAGSGGNGADVLAFAAATLGRPVPEPSTWTMLAIGLAGLAYVGYRRRAAASA